MRIQITIRVYDNNFRRDGLEREIEVVTPDDTIDLFSQVKFGALVEEHLANAVEEYAKAGAAPVANHNQDIDETIERENMPIGPLDQEVLQTKSMESF